jgi:hypothetical protein
MRPSAPNLCVFAPFAVNFLGNRWRPLGMGSIAQSPLPPGLDLRPAGG